MCISVLRPLSHANFISLHIGMHEKWIWCIDISFWQADLRFWSDWIELECKMKQMHYQVQFLIWICYFGKWNYISIHKFKQLWNLNLAISIITVNYMIFRRWYSFSNHSFLTLQLSSNNFVIIMEYNRIWYNMKNNGN